MRALTRAELSALDRRAVEVLGLPSIVLMENAGRQLADESRRRVRGLGLSGAWVLCGKGSNGGDGFACARHLFLRGIPASTFLLGPASALAGDSDAARNARALQALGAPFEAVSETEAIASFAERIPADALVVDAIFGTGLAGDVREPLRALIDALNTRELQVLSADIPSGLDADRGVPLGAAIRARATVTFAAPKAGFSAPGAAAYTGEVIVADIGVPVTA